jgi:hypothetical protein
LSDVAPKPLEADMVVRLVRGTLVLLGWEEFVRWVDGMRSRQPTALVITVNRSVHWSDAGDFSPF